MAHAEDPAIEFRPLPFPEPERLLEHRNRANWNWEKSILILIVRLVVKLFAGARELVGSDFIELELIDATWPARFPPELAARLQHILATTYLKHYSRVFSNFLQ